MRQLKKLPRKQLEKFSAVFMQLGLVLSLFVVYALIEYQTEIKQPIASVHEPNTDMYEIDYTRPIIYKKVEVNQEVPKPKERPQSTNLSDLEKVKDHEEKAIETVITPEKEDIPQIFNPNDLDEEEEEPEVIVDDVKSIKFVEEAPVFRGCEGLSKEENRKCFEEKLAKFVQRHFRSDLAQDLNLNSGKHKIYTQFVIDKTGLITDVKIRAPHVSLKKEANRIVSKIPKFTPGKQQGKPVKVRYTLPITFQVE